MNNSDKLGRPYVLIRCMTYNQERYIEETLKGFVMQKTNFPFVAAVIDDCSTDGTADIVRRYETLYPDIIKGIYLPHNFYSINEDKTPYYQEYIDRATYWAECEGDDFWTDPYKLQKQVDYMEEHPECALCHANAAVLKDGFLHHSDKQFRSDVLEDLLLRDNIFTCTALARMDEWNKADSIRKKIFSGKYEIPFSDHPMWVLLALNNEVHYINEEVGCYRILTESACHSHDKNKIYNYNAKVAMFHQRIFDYCKTKRSFSKEFENDFYEMLFHLRKRAVREAGLRIGYSQIWELIKLLPYWPMVMYRWLNRKTNGK